MDSDDIKAQAERVIAYFDAQLRAGAISREEHIIVLGELARWAERERRRIEGSLN